MAERYLVTITDNIAPSSMPYNEFVLYRNKNQKNEKQIIILLFKDSIDKKEVIPDDVESYCVGKNKRKLRSIVNQIVEKATGDKKEVVFHIHEAKSVVLFNIATFGKYRKNIIYTLHSTYKNYPLHNKILSLIASLWCSYTVCVSKTSYKYFPKVIKLFRGNKIRYVQNGVDIDRILNCPESESDERNDLFSLIYVARLRPSKRHAIVFNAIRDIPNVMLVLLGDGVLESELKLLAKNTGIDQRVKFCGMKRRDEVFVELKKADAYVSPSLYEGLPVGVLEAMVASLPCLLSNIEQHKEIAEMCRSVRLINDSVEEWKKEIEIVSRMDKEELKEEGRHNQEDVIKNYSLERMHRNYENLYSLVGYNK